MSSTTVSTTKKTRRQFQSLFEIMSWKGTVDFGNAATGSGTFVSEDITVSGAALGDFVIASISVDTVDTAVMGAVTAANTVTLTVLNNTAGAVNLADSVARILVLRPSAQIWK